MTMRSMPPASSHLADRPVPAPPPMIGSCRAIMAWNLSRMSLRAMRGMVLFRRDARFEVRDLAEVGGQRLGKRRVVDMQGQADELAVGRRLERLLDRREQRPVGG